MVSELKLNSSSWGNMEPSSFMESSCLAREMESSLPTTISKEDYSFPNKICTLAKTIRDAGNNAWCQAHREELDKLILKLQKIDPKDINEDQRKIQSFAKSAFCCDALTPIGYLPEISPLGMMADKRTAFIFEKMAGANGTINLGGSEEEAEAALVLMQGSLVYGPRYLENQLDPGDDATARRAIELLYLFALKCELYADTKQAKNFWSQVLTLCQNSITSTNPSLEKVVLPHKFTAKLDPKTTITTLLQDLVSEPSRLKELNQSATDDTVWRAQNQTFYQFVSHLHKNTFYQAGLKGRLSSIEKKSPPHIEKKSEAKAPIASNLQTIMHFAETENKDALVHLLKALNREELPDLIPQVLQKAANLNKINRRKYVSFIVSTLLECFPEFKDYFNSNYFMFTAKSIAFIVDHLISERYLPTDVNYIVCNSSSEFAQQIELIKQTSKPAKYAFIIRCFIDDGIHISSDVHMTAIYIERTGEGWRALNAESKGDESTRYPFEVCLPQKLPGIQRYYGGVERQRDGISCSIFALHDIMQIVNHPGIFEYLDSGSTHIEKYNLHLFSLSALPPKLMRVTQHEEHLQEYLKKISQGHIKEELLPGEDSLAEIVNKNRVNILKRNGVQKKVNNFAQKHFYEYQRLILKKLLSEPHK